jgi:hypothetical protein
MEHAKSTRLNRTISTAAFERLEYQCKSGKLLGQVSNEVQAHLTDYIQTPTAPRTAWLPGPGDGTDFQNRLKPLIDEIIAEGTKLTGIEVPRGADGCPFPGDKEDMPENWSYWMCRVFVGCRLIRLWLWCNGKWVCVICTETLFLTWLYCHVNGLRGITGITWNVRDRHVRGIVFAHERHGEQMVDFFPLNSTNLSEDLRAISDRNLRPETKFDNYAVHNWDQKKDSTAAADIKSQLDHVSISPNMYDPDRPLPKQPKLTDEDTTAAIDDDFGFARGLGADAPLEFEVESETEEGQSPRKKAAGKKPSKTLAQRPATATGKGKGKAKAEEQAEEQADDDGRNVDDDGGGGNDVRNAAREALEGELFYMQELYGDRLNGIASVDASSMGDVETLQQAMAATKTVLDGNDSHDAGIEELRGAAR